MQLYFIRHGIAIDRSKISSPLTDEDRPLTPQGQDKTKTIAQRLKVLNLSFDRLFTSPLRRAQETAEILQQAGLVPAVEIGEDLKPGGSITAWLEWSGQVLRAADQSIALVGHEPDLSQWAVQLVWGLELSALSGHSDPLQLKKAGIIGLTLPDTPPILGQGELFWLTPPRLLL